MKSFLILLILCSFIAKADRIKKEKIQEICNHYKVKAEFKDFKYNCNLILSLAFVESRFQINTYNPEKTGSYGLLQIQCATAKMVGLKFGCDQLFSPKVNIRFGMKYLSWLRKERKIETVKEVVASWNAGKVYLCKNINKDKKGKILCYPNQFINQGYVRNVYDHYAYLEKRRTTIENKGKSNERK